mgnify:CR=1 FL=1
MASACALAIFSGKNIYNFAILENLRIFQNRLFTGGVVTASGSCSAAFCESAALGGRTLSGSLRDATFPEGGRFYTAYRQMAKSSPFWGSWHGVSRD